MSDTDKKPIKKYFGVLIAVKDCDSAIEAARNASYSAFYIAISSLIAIYYQYAMGDNILEYGVTTDFATSVIYTMNIVVVLLFTWLGLRIHRGKFGSIPFLAFWFIIDVAVRFSAEPLRGMVFSLVFATIAFNALRGWYMLRKFSKPTTE